MSAPHVYYETGFAWDTACGDGYDYIDIAGEHGWHAVPNWGRDGWDLGDWPLVILLIRMRNHLGLGLVYELRTYTEGDLDTKGWLTPQERNEAIDEWAEWHWRMHPDKAPKDLPRTGLLAHHKGPFSWQRLDAEKEPT